MPSLSSLETHAIARPSGGASVAKIVVPRKGLPDADQTRLILLYNFARGHTLLHSDVAVWHSARISFAMRSYD